MDDVLTAHLFTPYYYNVTFIDPSTCILEPGANFNEYDIFALRTRLWPVLKQIDPSATIEFVPVADTANLKMFMGLRLVRASQPLILTENDLLLLQNKVDEVTADQPAYCLLCSADIEVYLDPTCRKRIPNNWIATMLPYLPLEDRINRFFIDGYLCIDLSFVPDFKDQYNKIFERTLQFLRQNYNRAAVVCTRAFAEEWELTAVVLDGFDRIKDQQQLVEDSLFDDQHGVYVPLWRDTRFAADMVEFLLERMTGSTRVRFELGSTVPTVIFQRIDKMVYRATNFCIIEGLNNLAEIRSTADLLFSNY